MLGKKLTLKIIGFKHNAAKEAIIERFIRDTQTIQFPDDWERIDEIRTGENYFSIHVVRQDTPEFNRVEKEFLKSMPKAKIV